MIRLSVVLTLACLSHVGLAIGQDDSDLDLCTLPDTYASVVQIVDELELRQSCFGRNRDTSELAVWFRHRLGEADLPPDRILHDRHLHSIEEIVERVALTIRREALVLEQDGLHGANAVHAVSDRIYREAPSRSGSAPLEAIDSEPQWSFDLTEDFFCPCENGAPLLTPVATLLIPNCSPRADSPGCLRAVWALAELMRAAELMAFLGQQTDPSLYAQHRALSKTDAMWRLYSTDARTQYPWEMVLNGCFYQRHIRKLERQSGQQLALHERQPLNWQVIFLHPGLGVEYVDDAPSGSRFAPAVVIEWVGINRWKFKEQNGDVTMAAPIGFSLVSTLSDRSDTNAFGHGLALHWNHRVTAGVTVRKGGEVGLFLSIGLADRIVRAESQLERVTERIRSR